VRALNLVRTGAIDPANLALADLPVPVPADDELLLRIAACAVCRTDLQIVTGDLAPHRLPIVPGHQVVGRVEAMGARVTDWTVGERAAVGWLAEACGHCAMCLGGRENLCPDARFTGWDRDGGYAEWMTVKAGFALRLPAGSSDIDAAPLLCGGVIGYRALRIANVLPGSRLGLYGFGASALLAIQVARHWGCEVYVATRNPAEKERAGRMGAAWVGGYDDTPPVRLDAAITFAPVGSVVVAALKSLERGATVAINAIHLDRVPEFSYDLLWGERSLRSVANYTRADAHEFLALAAEIPIRTEPESYALVDGVEALRRLGAGMIGGAAVLSI
jgi:alcohol dehydrogenase, propanol-preferring